MPTTKNSQPDLSAPGELPDLQTLAEKLLKARCRLLTREPWYGSVALSMQWIPSQFPWEEREEAKTMGVRIVNGGVVQCIWYPGFVHRQNIRELYGVIMHEIEHIVRLHCIRIGAERDRVAWNISCDYVTNGKKSKPICAYYDPMIAGGFIVPIDGRGAYLPEEWDNGQTTEVIYDKLVQVIQQRVKTSGGKPGKNGDKSGKDKSANGSDPDDGQYRCGEHGGQQIDSHEVWQQTDVSADEARQLIKDITEQATQKCQGSVPKHLTQILQDLNKPLVRWRELLRQYIGNHVGNRRLTYSRRNRRNDNFGVPGISHHAAGDICVIVDTSGSISNMELSQFFAEIETIANRAKVHVLQWDAAFQGYSKYRRGDWKKFKINGRGGTAMDAAVQWLTTNRLIADCVILLTDGYTGWAAAQPWYPECGMITVITASPDAVNSPGWGHVVYIKRNQK